MMRFPRVGIVGCGSITERGILPHLNAMNVPIVALCDSNLDRCHVLGAIYQIDACYSDFEMMLQDESVEAVIVATPIGHHYQQSKQALTAGKHVYVQKTMSLTVSEAEDLLHLAQVKGTVLAAAPGQMLLPVHKRLKDLISRGEIGTPYTAFSINCAPGHELEAIQSRQDTLNPSWYYQAGGGPLLDMGVYPLTTFVGLFGSVEEVFSFSSQPVTEKVWHGETIKVNIDLQYNVNLRFSTGMLAQFSTGYCAEPASTRWGYFTISGDKGSVDIQRLPSSSRYELTRLTVTGSGAKEHFGIGLGMIDDESEEGHIALDLADFLKCIVDGGAPQACPYTARHVIAVIQAITTSIAERRPVKLHSVLDLKLGAAS